ncbi:MULTISPECIES: hypothetical protein [unclassified Paenarthrobacter]|uniref:hypothetical protein n=1 Tax=unclassified Paenarthrobacter TaxID=2634190 RepID=UPI003CED331A
MTAVLSGEALQQSETGSLVETRTPDHRPVVLPGLGRSELLGAVWTASARLESLQWEVDAAQNDMNQALTAAAAAGAQLPDLAVASGMSFADIEQLLA